MLIAAVQWLQQTLLGTIATTVAVIAVASVGYMMLAGRIDVRSGARVVVGCFILFGATSIVAGIETTAGGAADQYAFASPPPAAAPAFATIPLPPARPAIPPTPYDPYAGAAVPPR